MTLTRTAIVRLLRYFVVLVLIVGIVVYAISRSLNYARGPEIVIRSPQNGSSIDAVTTLIVGQAVRVNSLSLNGSPISVDQQGNFSESVVLFPGENIITLSAKDQFGRSTEKRLILVGTGGAASATTTLP